MRTRLWQHLVFETEPRENRIHVTWTIPPSPIPQPRLRWEGLRKHRHRSGGGVLPHVHQATDSLSTRQLIAPPDMPSLSQKESSDRQHREHKWNGCQKHQGRHTLTEELGGVRVGGLLVVGESLVDDFSDSRVEALQLFVLGGHTGSA